MEDGSSGDLNEVKTKPETLDETSETDDKSDQDDRAGQKEKSGGDDPSVEAETESKDKEADKTEKKTTADDTGQISSDSTETSALTEAQTSLLQGYYIVKKGDSLVGISRKIYGTAAKARKICELNGIDDMDKIYAGQKLELP